VSRRSLFAASFAFLAACGSSPLSPMTGTVGGAGAASPAGTAGGVGATGAAGLTGGPGTAGAGATGATSGSGAAGSDGGDARCASTNDRATVTVHLIDGRTLGCDASSSDAGFADAGDGPLTFEGKIVSTDQNLIVVDSVAKIEIYAPGLDLSAVPHVAVRVRLAFKVFYACQQSLEIVTANPTDGSPSLPAGQLLVAVSDGGDPFPDSPYRVERVALGCFSAMGCGGLEPDAYALDFSFTDSGAAPTRAYMGQSVPFPSLVGALAARNLRSYQSAACDDYWNFAYTIVLFRSLGLD
jgi:hypothetical protein